MNDLRCPVCNTRHWWHRRERLAFDEGKSVSITCLMCGKQYWIWNSKGRIIISREREND